MGTLEIVMVTILVICILVDLIRTESFWFFVGAVMGDVLSIGIIYVILHLVFKHW